MIGAVEELRPQIEELCKRYEVQLLELFGSAARDDFDPATSDFDFQVAFLPEGTVNAADGFLGLLVDLEELLKRKIDLVDVRAHRNPFFMAEASSNLKPMHCRGECGRMTISLHPGELACRLWLMG